MEKEALRRQIFDEIQAQFEIKLRDVRRQKANVEEELESASERWRSERRRLNAEIERLMAKATPQVAESRPAASDDRLSKAQVEWEGERTRLKSQVNRLERAVAEAIERSSNPLRSTQPLKEQFEARLEEAAKAKAEVEKALLRAKAEWDEDRKKLTTEIMRLRRLAPPDKALQAKEKLEQMRGRKETIEESRIRELEQRLSEANSEVQRHHQAATVAREEEAARSKGLADDTLRATRELWEQERTQLLAQIQQLQRTLADSHESINDQVVDQLRQQYDQKLQDIIQQRTGLAQELERATQLLAEERAHFAAEASQPGASGMNDDAMASEIQRIETLIQQVVELIDNPATELSTIIRKNVEKAELDAYLKGILFALGRGSAL